MRAFIFVLPALLALTACDGGTQGAGVTDAETQPNERAVAAGEAAPEETAAPSPTPESGE